MTLAPVPPARGDQAAAAGDAEATVPADPAGFTERRSSLGKITTRPSVAEDSAFMLELYASTSKDELDDLGWSIGGNRTFVIMQAQTEEWNRSRLYPGMDRLTICVDEMPVGRLLVCLRNDILHLVDLSLLPRFRGLGIGTQLVGEILDEARNARVPVKVRVRKNSNSVRFVERLGFGTLTDLGLHVELTWMPPLTALGPDAREEGFSSKGTRVNRSVSEETLDSVIAVDEPVASNDFADFAPIEPIEAATSHLAPARPSVTAESTVASSPVEAVVDVVDVEEVDTASDSDTVEDTAEDVAFVENGAEEAAPAHRSESVAVEADVTDVAVEENVEDVAVIEEDSDNPIKDANQAVLAYVNEADSEYLVEPVWLAPEVVVEDEPEEEEEEEE